MSQEKGQQQSFSASRQDLSTPAHDIKIWQDESLVKVEINYPDKFEGQKFFKNGDITWTSRESADIMIEAGIGTEINRTKDEKAGSASTGTDGNDKKLDEKGVTGTNAIKADDSAVKAESAEAISSGRAKKA